MITEIIIENFKCLRKLNLSLGQVQTVLVGPNGSGKSSVLQALLVLAQSCLVQTDIDERHEANRIETTGPYINLGPIDALISHDSSGTATIGVRARATPPHGVLDLPQVPIEFLLRFSADGEWMQTATFGILDRNISVSCGPRERHIDAKELQVRELKFGLEPTMSIGNPISVKTITAPTGTQAEAEQIRNQLSEVFTSPRRLLRNVFPVPSMRGFDSTDYPFSERPVDQMVTNRGITQQARFTASEIAYRRLENRISNWMRSITGIDIKTMPTPGPRISVETTAKNPVNMINEGYGTNQLVFLLAQLARSPPGSIVTLEEPESHLHPKAQAALVDLLTEIAKAEGKQVLFTTHSDHVVFRLLTQVAEGKLGSSEDITAYAFQRRDSMTHASRLKVDQKGRIEGGLHDFFEADVEGFEKFLGAVGA